MDLLATPTLQPSIRRRRPWSRLLTSALALALIVGAAACSDDGNDDASDTASTVSAEIGDAAAVESTVAPEGSTESTAAPETTPTTPPPPVGAADPESSAATYYMAWKAGDTALAATVAEPAAVDAMATIAAGDYSLYNRCNTGEFGQSTCLYRGNPGTIQFSMSDASGAWVVTTVFFSAA